MDEDIVVEVTVPTETEVEPPAESTDVVVVNTPDDTPTDALVTNAIDSATRIAELEAQLALLTAAAEQQAATTAVVAEQAAIANETSQVAIDVALEAMEGEQAPPEQDDEPNRDHPFFRSWK